ncbi:type I restriction-modification system subunit M [Spiroplasma endosymbiont of Amphibalanus improvisus]|uniref:type I restriction-modification system subunit M n=1 Tax=Spiroplasma endosymbiont of Amphibalanus improvisus TaxID=3066327 RepID=UPI00313BAA6C
MQIKEIETKLWQAADQLRGNMSAEEYMHTILGILSLKYISDKFDTAIEKLKQDGLELSDIEPDELYGEYDAFIVPEKSSWKHIINHANSPQIGQVIDEALIAIQNKNKILKGIFNTNYNNEGIDQNRLGEVVKIFSDEKLNFEKEDIIGRIYEFFLGKFFKDRGQKGGEFYTPTSIVQLMVSLIKPLNGTIYDPACGSGGILIQSKRYIESHGGDITQVNVYGQEFNQVTWKLAKLNLILNNFPLTDSDDNKVLGVKSADTFTEDQHLNLKFDYVMTNPPFNLKQWNYEKLLDDPRWKYGIPPKGNANYAWLSHVMSKLSSKGKAAVVLANGSLSTSQNGEKEIRTELLKQNKVDMIIGLPSALFYTTGIPASIWIFNNNKTTDKVLMVNATEIGTMISKKLRELQTSEIEDITKLYDKHSKGEDINQVGFAKNVSLEELAENDYSLVPGRYVGYEEEVVDKEAAKAEIKKISIELKDLFKEFNELMPKVEESIDKAMNFKEEE